MGHAHPPGGHQAGSTVTPSVGPGPLAGVRVLDLTSVLMGPFATLILAQLGAEVIKLESPEGDVVRQIGPMKPGHEHDGLGPLFVQTNMGKKSVALDLKAPEGRAAAVRLAQEVDVLVSNLRPQALLRLGLDEASLRPLAPRLIHVSCVGFDPEGPYADKPAYDDLIQGATGIPWLMQRHGSPQRIEDLPQHALLGLDDSMARHRTGGENFANWILSQRMVPPIAVVFPLFLLYVYFGLVDTYLGLILLYTAFNLPYVIWMMRGYILDIPLALEESALVDGCSRWQVIWKVVFPMSRAGLFATAIFTFVFAFVLLLVLKIIMGLRVSPEEESEGLDIGEHGNVAQQAALAIDRKSVV